MRPATAFAVLVLISAGPLAAQHSNTTGTGYDPAIPTPRAPTADSLSPLLAGVEPGELAVPVTGGRIYRVPRDLAPQEAVIRYASLPRLRFAGYLWPEVPARLAESPWLWTERAGRGRVIGFAGDPNFRDLWRGLLPVFANAVLLGASF